MATADTVPAASQKAWKPDYGIETVLELGHAEHFADVRRPGSPITGLKRSCVCSGQNNTHVRRPGSPITGLKLFKVLDSKDIKSLSEGLEARLRD